MHSEFNLNPISDNLSKLPPVLYKYRSFDKYGFWKSMVENGEVFFARADQFNDPFDCSFIPKSEKAEGNLKEFKRHIKVRTKVYAPNKSRIERRKLEKQALRKRKKQKGKREVDSGLLELQYAKVGVLSMATDCNSLPMWANYAENHTGICVGFKTTVIGEIQKKLLEKGELLSLYKVQYTEDIPVVNIDVTSSGLTDEEREEVAKTFYTKSKFWEYENEYRLLYWHNPGASFELGNETISEVIIGSRVDKENEKKIRQAIADTGAKFEVKKAVPSKSKYALEFQDFK